MTWTLTLALEIEQTRDQQVMDLMSKKAQKVEDIIFAPATDGKSGGIIRMTNRFGEKRTIVIARTGDNISGTVYNEDSSWMQLDSDPLWEDYLLNDVLAKLEAEERAKLKEKNLTLPK